MNVRPVRLPLGPNGFARLSNVSRETLDRLSAYVQLLDQWNRRINLVGRNTIGDVWRRHILDCAQLYPLLPRTTQTLVDLGAGAGLPGIVLAIMGVPQVHLIESDLRKAAFLREAIRITEVDATVHAGRIEQVPAFAADVITARACADLSTLLDLSEKFRGRRTVSVFLKGASAAEELAAASQQWEMRAEKIPSRSDSSGVILKLDAVKRRADHEPG